mmetsp:Transcript_36648/g.92631  ORF Transcript_36648/g.92631 Transcript_36648/m.92631 type:complete len:234 (-) Transcript_36648:601-1302(-)
MLAREAQRNGREALPNHGKGQRRVPPVAYRQLELKLAVLPPRLRLGARHHLHVCVGVVHCRLAPVSRQPVVHRLDGLCMQQCHRSAVRGLSHQRAEHRRGPDSRVAMADGALVAGLQRLAQRAQHVGLQKAADEGAPVAIEVVVVLQDGGGVGAHAAGHHHGGDVVPCVHVPLHQPAACLPGGRPREGVRRRPVRVPQVKQHDGWPRRQAERRAQPQLQHGLHHLGCAAWFAR